MIGRGNTSIPIRLQNFRTSFGLMNASCRRLLEEMSRPIKAQTALRSSILLEVWKGVSTMDTAGIVSGQGLLLTAIIAWAGGISAAQDVRTATVEIPGG